MNTSIQKLLPAPLVAALFLGAPFLGHAAEREGGDGNGVPNEAAAAAAADEPEGEAYEIVLRRPMFVGMRFREITTARYEQSQVHWQGGSRNETESDSWSIFLDCSQKVLETTPDGSPKAYRLEFARLERTRNGETEKLLPENTTIMAARPGRESIFTRNGRPVGEELTSILDDLFGMSSEDRAVSSDQVFGSEIKRRIGERWPVNERHAMAWFDDVENMRINNLTGETTLLGVKEVDGEPCLDIGHTLSVRFMGNIVWRGGGERHFTHTMRLILPKDPEAMERGYQMTRRIRESLPMGGLDNESIDIIIDSTYDTEIIPLPPAPDAELPAGDQRDDGDDEA